MSLTKALAAASKDADRLATLNDWVSVIVDLRDRHFPVMLDHGIFGPNGADERSIGTIKYDYEGNSVRVVHT